MKVKKKTFQVLFNWLYFFSSPRLVCIILQLGIRKLPTVNGLVEQGEISAMQNSRVSRDLLVHNNWSVYRSDYSISNTILDVHKDCA